MIAAGPLGGLSWPRRTQRLSLRPAQPDDVEQVWAFRGLPEVGSWITARPPDLEQFRRYFVLPERLDTTLVVSLLDAPDQLVGDLMLDVQDAWAQLEVRDRARGTQAELGWAFAPTAGGRGYATEAVAELLAICFGELGIRRVEAACFAANEPSWRLMERLGMRRETHSVRESLHRSGEWMDGFAYALLAEEWRARG
ncbi:MAG: GNAT family N-acetyltransferase [Nocardioides sp.]|nr:GNAT family N-acetyltransferase [Nocardioides sp.]